MTRFVPVALLLNALALPAGLALAQAIPRPDHVVVVIEENKSYGQIIGSARAPYINALARRGALFTRSFAVAHPSEPNYLALFSGSTHGVPDDRCPLRLSGDNLATELARKGLGFATYSESLPSAGFTGCAFEHYARKHNPAADWTDAAPEANLPFAMFPADYSKLPAVSFVVPDQLNDMHDGEPPESIAKADRWLKENLDAYVRWAATHDSLLILTWDEDDGSSGNRIATIFVGPMIRRGAYARRIDHYGVLRTLTDMYGLRPLGEAGKSAAIREIWSPGRSGR